MEHITDDLEDDLPSPVVQHAGVAFSGSPTHRARMSTMPAGDLSGSYQAPALARTLTSKMSSIASLFPEQTLNPLSQDPSGA